mgnify:CR=1 FL=1
MNIEKSLSDKFWEEKQIDFKHIQALSQKKSISEIFSKLLISRGVFEDDYDNYINPNLLNNLPDPFELKDMKKGIERCIEALKNNEKIGIIADYDVDGSTSASILCRFLNNYTNDLVCKIPNRLSEGYGPNTRIMEEFLNLRYNIIFTIGSFDEYSEKESFSQDMNSLFGSIIMINKQNQTFKILSKGHRNQQGLYYDKDNGYVLETEHGPYGGDEINLIEVEDINKGNLLNFGWAVASYGEHYGGKNESGNVEKYKKYPLYKSHSDHGFIEPLHAFVPSIGISEITKIGDAKSVSYTHLTLPTKA